MLIFGASGRLATDEYDGSKMFGFWLILNGIGSKDLRVVGLGARVASSCSACLLVASLTGCSPFFCSSLAALLAFGDLFFLRTGRSRALGGAGVPHTTVRMAFKANMGAGVCGGWASSPEASTELVRIQVSFESMGSITFLPGRRICESVLILWGSVHVSIWRLVVIASD